MKQILAILGGVLLLSGPANQALGARSPEGFALQGDAHATFTVGTATASRGQKALGVLEVPAGSDGGYDMPVAGSTTSSVAVDPAATNSPLM